MKSLQAHLIWPGCAQGRYVLSAKGCMLAELRWGDAEAPLKTWGPIAYVPIDPVGNGSFTLPNGRGIPREATHVWARLFAAGFAAHEDVRCEIPVRFLRVPAVQGDAQHVSVLTDLHLSTSAHRVRRALEATAGDAVLILGDATNDGLPGQFETFEACIEEVVPDKVVLPVTGNHDVARAAPEEGPGGCEGYDAFQGCLLERAEGLGLDVSRDPDGRAYAVRLGLLDVVGLQCVVAGRRFLFPEGRQLDWLEGHLSETKAPWHVIMCHAPLLAHNPRRNTGAPYLDRDARLQSIVDRCGSVVFLSGHTHSSPNVLAGNCDYDRTHRNIYLDCGSVVATDVSTERGLMSSDWKDGCVAEIVATEESVEICMRSIERGTVFPRGYYRLEGAMLAGQLRRRT